MLGSMYSLTSMMLTVLKTFLFTCFSGLWPSSLASKITTIHFDVNQLPFGIDLLPH